MNFRATNIYFIMAATWVALTGIFALTPTAEVQAQDFSKAYRYGGGINIPGAGNVDEEVDIIEIENEIDAGGVLGCSGLDLGGMVQNTLNVGDLAGEFQSYLQNTLATEALSLLYSQPGVSQVLDGMKAVGHARASILQEKCNANEIMQDATDRRLKSEAQDLCLKDKEGMVECEGLENLRPYIDELKTSTRWSGTLHDHMCPKDEDGNRSAVCDFMPNFGYDAGAKVGKSSRAKFTTQRVGEIARQGAEDCLKARGRQVSALIDAKGYSCAQRLLGAGAVKLTCTDGGSFNPSGLSCNSADIPAAAGDDNPAAAGLSGEDGCPINNSDDLEKALKNNPDLETDEILSAYTQCKISKARHSHIDLNMATMKVVDAIAEYNSTAEIYKLETQLEKIAMEMRKLSDVIINSGGRDSVKSCPPVDEDGNVDLEGENSAPDPDCKPSPPPQQLDNAAAKIEQLRDDREALMAKLEIQERVTENVNRMNREREERIQEGGSSASRAAQRGGRASQSASQRTSYPDFFQ